MCVKFRHESLKIIIYFETMKACKSCSCNVLGWDYSGVQTTTAISCLRNEIDFRFLCFDFLFCFLISEYDLVCLPFFPFLFANKNVFVIFYIFGF